MIGIVDYGAGNLRSVEFALDELGAPHRRVSGPGGLEEVERVILPGVGAAASAMRELRRRDLVGALRETRRPLLGICLGMQLLVESSDEGGEEVPCLGLIPGRTRRIQTDAPLPHIGWNRLEPSGGPGDELEPSGGSGGGRDPLFSGIRAEGSDGGGDGGRTEGFHCYFLHGHRVRCGERYVRGRAEYGERFPAAVRHGRVAGLQFHPEKSGPVGLRMLSNFCDPAEEAP